MGDQDPSGTTPERARGAFSLIELVVVVAVIGILASLILPAVQAARESSRRSRCANNLKQLALAAHGYHDVHGAFPMGTPFARYPDVGVFPGPSVFVALLGRIEQQPLWNSINFDKNIYTYANQTAHESAPGVLWCPSDAASAEKTTYPGAYFDIPAGRFVVSYSSYAACAGTWYHLAAEPADLPALTAQDNGIAFANSAIRLADITDGTAQTFLLGERAHGKLAGAPRINWHWWFDGYYGDTLFWTMHPINPGRLVTPDGPAPGQARAEFASAFSLHPGGANFAFADGSVRFLKETTDSWPIDPATGLPPGARGSSRVPYVLAPGTRPGVYQALSTRAGGEVVTLEP